VKFGIDKRDSMLTRENFKDTWARPKPEDKRKSGKADGEEMSVDVPPMNSGSKHNEDNDAEMGGVVDNSLDERTMEIEKGEVRNQKSKSDMTRKMPVFAFQRRGIGAVKSKQNPKPKNTSKNLLPPQE
jgi:hypothetical protein